MPWEVIIEALREKEIYPYLRRIIGSYLGNRKTVTAEGAPNDSGSPPGLHSGANSLKLEIWRSRCRTG